MVVLIGMDIIQCSYVNISLTHICLASFCGTQTNSVAPDQTPQNPASDQRLHCLHTACSISI